MSKVLVTGGAGFIGSHIVDLLLENNQEVISVDNLSSGHNLNNKTKFYKVDIRNKDGLEKVFKENKIDFVIHTAAQISVSRSVREPLLDEEINIKGILNLLELSKDYKVKKFIFSSSGGVMYGQTKIFPTPETVCPEPLSPYGIAKLASERYIIFYNKEFNLNYTILRYGNVYGPRQDPNGEAGVVAIFTKRMLKDMQVTINGDGKYVRDYVYVKDVARANVFSLEKGDEEIINIGTAKGTDVNELFNELKELTGYKREAVHGPPRPGDLRKSLLDISKAKSVLGWAPKYNLNEGLKETVEFFKNVL